MLGVGLSDILRQQSSPHNLNVNRKGFNATTQVTTSLPEEQHYGKGLAGRPLELHTQLDGVLQVLLGNVEAVVVDLAALKDVLTGRALLESGRR